MSEIKFNHRKNPEHLIDGKKVWLSRAPAVCSVVFSIQDNKTYILGEKRSEQMMDSPRMWCIPSGYLDWDENGWDAMVREVYEETGFYVPDNEKHILGNNNKQPWHVNTEPTENRQNVAIYYVLIYDFESEMPDVSQYKNVEIEEVKWIDISQLKDYDWAFAHDRRIAQAALKFGLYESLK